MNSLSLEQPSRRDFLLEGFRRRTITRNEAEELRNLLDHEREEAFNIGDLIIGLGAVFLLAALIVYITDLAD